MVIVYKLTNITYWLVKKVIKIPFIGLCNIVAEKKIVPELIQHQATAQNIAAAIKNILDDKEYREAMTTELQGVKQKLDSGSNAQKIENVVLNLLGAVVLQ